MKPIIDIRYNQVSINTYKIEVLREGEDEYKELKTVDNRKVKPKVSWWRFWE